MSEDEVTLVYDGQCPACDFYCRTIRISDDAGELHLIDARDDSAIRDEITRMGLDIDEGMVLKRNGRIYHGADAIHALAAISCPHGIFNRQNRWLFRSHNVAARLYPVLRACRNLLLKLLGRHRINNLNIPGNDRF